MSGLVLSRPLFEALVKHLVDMEEEKDRTLDEYYPNETEERDGFKQLISDYISTIEDYISNAIIEETESRNCPFVTIGSIVEVEDLTYNETAKFQIVSPIIDTDNMGWECASYLSPIGKALLLRKVSERVDIKIPEGKSAYKIKSIELPY